MKGESVRTRAVKKETKNRNLKALIFSATAPGVAESSTISTAEFTIPPQKNERNGPEKRAERKGKRRKRLS